MITLLSTARATGKRKFKKMLRMRKLQVVVAVATLSLSCAFAQKTKVGYDKNADFSKYKSYTLQEPAAPASRPLLYASVMGTIRQEVETKGLTRADKDGDLTVIPTGGLDYGLGTSSGVTSDSCANCQKPLVDARDWVGKQAPPGGGGKVNPNGVLQLDFVDRATNKVVWSGAVTQKLNPDKKEQSLQKVGAAIQKLLAEYPPKSK
jgi:Domain of unknown function (DUF4136)